MIDLIKKDLGLYISLSMGVFLFILFFELFIVNGMDFNNRLLFVSGLGGIIFIVVFLTRNIFILIHKNNSNSSINTIPSSYITGLIIFVSTSIAFAFYIRYVGSVHISFFLMFKIMLICFAITTILGLNDMVHVLKAENTALHEEVISIHNQINQYQDKFTDDEIELISDYNTDNLKLYVSDIIFIKSADNYVEIGYTDSGKLKKKLIRNTLKVIEQQLKLYSTFIRCHRTSIINMAYISKLNKKFNNYSLSLKGTNEQIPVSRQYLIRLKERIEKARG